MDRAIEKRLCERAVALGNAGDGAALAELAGLSASASAQVRRLAVSAIGKLAGLAESAGAVGALVPCLRDVHPQVRQYAVKALAAYGAAAQTALADLADVAANPGEKDYNQRDAGKAIETIREAVRIAEKQAVHRCQRCDRAVAPDEYVRSRRAFQRVLCDACFDEVFLARRNFETKVELNKTIEAGDGTLVQSDGERRIAEWLSAEGIAYRYDERFRILDGYAIRPDFYLPEFDVYIEYWGMDTADYKIGMLKKQQLYQQQGKRLVSVHFRDKAHLEVLLRERLGRYVRLGAGAADDSAAGMTD